MSEFSFTLDLVNFFPSWELMLQEELTKGQKFMSKITSETTAKISSQLPILFYSYVEWEIWLYCPVRFEWIKIDYLFLYSPGWVYKNLKVWGSKASFVFSKIKVVKLKFLKQKYCLYYVIVQCKKMIIFYIE